MAPFDVLLDQVERYLSEKHYARCVKSFRINKFNNMGMIDFQKSIKNSRSDGSVMFTANVGICSARLMEFFGNKPSRITVADCHLSVRLGRLLPERVDTWWAINSHNLNETIANFRDYMCVADFYINRHIRHEDLIALWSKGESPGLTDFQRLMNLSVLLKTFAAGESLKDVCDQILVCARGKPWEMTAREHLAKLERGVGP
jgi:hypothetical protein